MDTRTIVSGDGAILGTERFWARSLGIVADEPKKSAPCCAAPESGRPAMAT